MVVLWRVRNVLAALLILAGCSGPELTEPPQASTIPIPTAIASPFPIATEPPIAEPYFTSSPPTPTPIPEPTASYHPVEYLIPVGTPAGPDAQPTSDINVVETAYFSGKVYDDQHNPLDKIKIFAHSLNSSVPFEAISKTNNDGAYVFDKAPTGIQVEIIASYPGLTTRRRVEVIKCCCCKSDPNANKYDFGTSNNRGGNGSKINALSDKPEIVAAIPGRNASEVDARTSFKLTFSEPMNTTSVEDNFVIRAYQNTQLSVDNQVSLYQSEPPALSEYQPQSGSILWDKNAFEIHWNSDDTEALFKFKPGLGLPTDKAPENTPTYYVSFTRGDGQIKDKAGITRSGHYFKLTDGNFEGAYTFRLRPDTTAPHILKSTLQDNHLLLEFSEAMHVPSLSLNLAGGLNGNAAQAPAALANAEREDVTAQNTAQNYRLTVSGPQRQFGPISWQALGGQARYDAENTQFVHLIRPQQVGELRFSSTRPTTAKIKIRLVLRNGQTHAHEVPLSLTPKELQDAVNDVLYGAPFRILRAHQGHLDSAWVNNEKLNFYLDHNAQWQSNTQRPEQLLAIHFEEGEALKSFSDQPFSIYPGLQAGASPAFWQAGDKLKIEVAETVLDPAGNAMQENANIIETVVK